MIFRYFCILPGSLGVNIEIKEMEEEKKDNLDSKNTFLEFQT